MNSDAGLIFIILIGTVFLVGTGCTVASMFLDDENYTESTFVEYKKTNQQITIQYVDDDEDASVIIIEE